MDNPIPKYKEMEPNEVFSRLLHFFTACNMDYVPHLMAQREILIANGFCSLEEYEDIRLRCVHELEQKHQKQIDEYRQTLDSELLKLLGIRTKEEDHVG